MNHAGDGEAPLQDALRVLAERSAPPDASVRRARRVADVLGRLTGRRPLPGPERRP